MTPIDSGVELRPGVRLTMPALPENVSLARQLVAGLAEALDIDAALSADMKIAVTEACTNVVVHAYPEATGAADVTVTTLPGHVVVAVGDRGIGFKPAAPRAAAALAEAPVATLGFGLSLIATLSDEFSITSGAAGTEVQMLFTLGEQPRPDAGAVFAETRPLAVRDSSATGAAAAGDLVLTFAKSEPLVPLLGRVTSLLAARAGFSIDRLSDAQLVSDTIATHAPRLVPAQTLSVVVTELDGAFELLVGEFAPGGGEALVADSSLPGLGSLLERLTDGLSVESAAGDGAGELVRLRLARRQP